MVLVLGQGSKQGWCQASTDCSRHDPCALRNIGLPEPLHLQAAAELALS
jgi:hypothetical protein